MPKYYCDYCDTYLTHDSPSVRKTHNSGRKHKDNVKYYYQKWMEEQAQSLIDQTTKAFERGSKKGQAFANVPPPGVLPPGMMPPMPGGVPPPGAIPFGMPPPNAMLPPNAMPPPGMGGRPLRPPGGGMLHRGGTRPMGPPRLGRPGLMRPPPR